MNLPGNISDKTTSHDQDRLLAEHAKLVHRVDDAEERVNALGLLANHGFVDLEVDLVVVKVPLHLLPVQVEDVEVHDREAPLPALVARGQLRVAHVEDSVEELEVILDLLVPADGEPLGGGLDGGFHVRHDE